MFNLSYVHTGIGPATDSTLTKAIRIKPNVVLLGFDRLDITVLMIHHLDSVSLIMFSLQPPMVCLIGFQFISVGCSRLLAAHLHHGIRRVIVLDIDLHHGRLFGFSRGSTCSSGVVFLRKRYAIHCMVNQCRNATTRPRISRSGGSRTKSA